MANLREYPGAIPLSFPGPPSQSLRQSTRQAVIQEAHHQSSEAGSFSVGVDLSFHFDDAEGLPASVSRKDSSVFRGLWKAIVRDGVLKHVSMIGWSHVLSEAAGEAIRGYVAEKARQLQQIERGHAPPQLAKVLIASSNEGSCFCAQGRDSSRPPGALNDQVRGRTAACDPLQPNACADRQ